VGPVDSGAHWAATTLTAATYGLAVDPTGTILYAGTNAGTYKSVNGGGTWTSMVSTDLATAMLVDPLTPTTVYEGLGCASNPGTGASGLGGIRLSTNSGAMWGAPVGNSCVDAFVGLPSGTLFALGAVSGDPGDISRSTDHGATWTTLAYTGGAGLAVSADAMTIYIATAAGLYKSTTGGM
jgi:hypothetical protein